MVLITTVILKVKDTVIHTVLRMGILRYEKIKVKCSRH